MDMSRRPEDDVRGNGPTDYDRDSGDQAGGRAEGRHSCDQAGDTLSDTCDSSDADAALTDLLRRARGPLEWRALSSHEAATAWGELREWVGWLRTEFGFDHRVVPPCWYRHRALVSVLSALHDHWLAGYDPMGSLLGPGEWHRGLIQLEMRLREWASRTGCSVGEHRADVAIAYPPDDDAWQANVADDVAARRSRERHQRTVSGERDSQLPIPLALVPADSGNARSGGNGAGSGSEGSHGT